MADDATVDQSTGPLAAVSVKPLSGKSAYMGVTPSGNTLLTDESSSGILANMQKMINEKEAQKNSFLENMKDAVAWTTGGVNGPTQGLALRGEQKEKEAADIYNMRQQMAQFKAQQDQSSKLSQSLWNEVKGGNINGIPMDATTSAEIMRLLGNGQLAEAQKLRNTFVTENIKFGSNPASYKRDIPMVVMRDGKESIEPVDAVTARQMALSGNARYANPEDKQRVEAQPGAGQAKPGLAISAGNLTWNDLGNEQKDKLLQSMWKMEGFGADPKNVPTRHNNPGDLVFGDFAKKFGAVAGDTIKGPDGVTRTFAKFKTPEDGKAASRALWDQVYANKPLDESLTKLRGEASPSDQYRKAMYDGAGIKYTTAGGNVQPSTITNAAKPVATQPTTTQPVVTSGRSTVSQVEQRMKVEEKALTAELEKTGQDLALRRSGTEEARDNSGERLASIKYVNGLLQSNPRAFGVLQHPGVLNAIGTALEGGTQVGKEGVYSSKNIDDAVRKAMKGATEEDIIVAQKAANQLALAQLSAAKVVLKGQGAVSDNERDLVRQMTGSIKNSPEALKDILKFNEMRANFDSKVGAALDKWDSQPGNEGKSYRQFMLSPEYLALRAEYKDEVDRFAKVAGSMYSKETKAATPVGPKEGELSKSKSGKDIIFRNGQWEYK